METNKLYNYNVNERVKQLGLNLKTLKNPIKNNYLHSQRTGNLLFLSGKISQKEDNTFITGKVGENLTTNQGKEAARLVAISQLSVLQTELGDLNKVIKIVNS